jgi:hypothetical protein
VVGIVALLTSDTSTIVLNLVAFHANFMASDDGLEVVSVTKPLCDIWPKLQANASFAGTSSFLRLRISPEHFHHKPALSRLPLLMPVELSDVIQGDIVVRKQASVQCKIMTAYQSCQRKGGERLREEFKNAFGVLVPALALETVHTIHIICLVIATVEEKGGRIKPFVGVQEESNFGGPGSSIHEIAVEKVRVGCGWETIETEDLQKIEELTYVPESVITRISVRTRPRGALP